MLRLPWRREVHPGHPQAIERVHPQRAALHLHAVAQPRPAPQLSEHEPADRGVGALVDVERELRVDVAGQGEPVEAWGADAVMNRPDALLKWLTMA